MVEEDTPAEKEKEVVPTQAQDLDNELFRLKEKNKAIQEQLIKAQKLKSEMLLSGESGGNVPPVEIPESEKKKEGAKEFFKGTALEDDIDKL